MKKDDDLLHLSLSSEAPRVAVVTTPRPKSRKEPKGDKPLTISPPFPWATSQRATVHSLQHLLSHGVSVIPGEVFCRRCQKRFVIQYPLRESFESVSRFMISRKDSMNERAPKVWMNPVLPKCRFCDNEKSVKPVMARKKKEINWLFLLLGQMIGCCKLKQLKYFCKHTDNHRTGAKDRVVYLTYLAICNQLNPGGPFERV